MPLYMTYPLPLLKSNLRYCISNRAPCPYTGIYCVLMIFLSRMFRVCFSCAWSSVVSYGILYGILRFLWFCVIASRLILRFVFVCGRVLVFAFQVKSVEWTVWTIFPSPVFVHMPFSNITTVRNMSRIRN